MNPFHRHPEWRSIKSHRRSNVSFWTPCFSGFSKSQSCEENMFQLRLWIFFLYTHPKTKLRCNLTKTSCFAQREGCPCSCSMKPMEPGESLVLGKKSHHPTTEGVKDSWGFGGRLAKAQVSWLKEGDSIRQTSWQQPGGSPPKKERWFLALFFAQNSCCV